MIANLLRAVLLVSCLLRPVLATPTEQLNVLFIAVDDFRNCAGAFGDPLAKTPHLDSLARRGTVFRNAHCQIAICNPSRASVMTGMRPDKIKVWGLAKHFRQERPNAVTLPQLFKRKGYSTHSIGKIYHGTGETSQDPPSWSDKPEFDRVTKREAYRLEKNRTGRKAAASERADVNDDEYIDGKVAAAAIRKLQQLRAGEKPFFLAVGFRKPHMPFAAPAKYWDLYRRPDLAHPTRAEMPVGAPSIARHDWPEARGYTDVPREGPIKPEKIAELRHGYYAATSFMDAQLGRVLDELNRSKLEDRTVIALYGDHGFHIGEQDLWGKLTNYDTATRAPLLIAYPRQKDKGATVERAVEFLDIYPTLAELCGLDPPSTLEGQSLRKVLDDRDAELKNFAISQFARPGRYSFKNSSPENMGYSIRTERYRYTRWVVFNNRKLLAEEFYDLRTNRIESKNEIENPKYAQSIAELRERLGEHIGTAP